MHVRAFLFDVGDTLWHAPAAPAPAVFRRIAAERAAVSLSAAGVAADAELVARLAWDTLEEAMAAARRGDLREPDYAARVADRLGAHGVLISASQASALLEDIYVSGAEGGKVAFPDARETLLELKRRGFLLATVTNRAFGGERYRLDLRECGLDIGWDAHAVSVEVGFLKPHPEPFEAALRALRLAPAEAVMVGNSLREDIAGAQAVGIRAAWRRSPADAEGVGPDWTVDTLGALLALPGLQSAA